MASTKAKIEITFTRDVLDNEYISFERTSDLGNATILSTFKSSGRRTGKELPIEIPTATPGEMTAITYERYFNVDHNSSGLMVLTRNVNVIEIEIDINWDFSNFVTDTGANDIIEQRIPDTFSLTNASLQIHPTEPCEYVDVEILTSEQAQGYSIGRAPIELVSTNPFTVSIPRLQPISILVAKPGSESLDVSLLEWNEPNFYFNKIGQDNINIDITVDPFSGATIVVSVDYLNQLTPRPNLGTLEYSLDDVNYFPNGLWEGQLAGDYTVYIKDSFGCTVSKEFTVVGGVESQNPFIEVSERNSVSFSKDEVWDGLQDGIHKNFDNTLALTGFNKFNYDERVVFRDEDKIRIQFKSNYSDHEIHVQGCDGGEVGYNPFVEKMSNNLGLFEGLDCVLHKLPNGRSGLYFNDGKVYDENDVYVADYELFGNLPDSATIGNVVKIEGHGTFTVVDVIYDAEIDKRLMVFDYEYTGNDVVTIMKCYYNLLPFEIYEFDIDFSIPIIKPGERVVRLRIQFLDNLYDEVNYYSEYCLLLQDVDYDPNKYVALNYYGTNNRNVFYLYGLTHFLRAEVEDIKGIIDDNVDVVKGDNSTYLSESVVNKGMNISFSEVTYRVMVKLSLALSSENLFVNGLGYVKKDAISIEPIENTNLYKVTCELLSTNKNFNTSLNDSEGVDEGYKTIYIPQILGTDTGSIKL